MKITKIQNYQTYGNLKKSPVQREVAFGAYVYKPQSKKTIVDNMFDFNPIKHQLDRVIATALKMAKRRIFPLNKELNSITNIVDLNTSKGKKLSYAWDINPNNRQKYVLFLHGTGQNITNLQSLYAGIVKNTDYAVLAPEFRGVGANPPDVISNQSFMEDATAALNYLRKKGVKDEDICIAGHSLGCHVATDLTIQNKKLNQLILMSPINSFTDNMNIEESLKNNVSRFTLYLYKNAKFLSRDIDEFYGVGELIPKTNTSIDIIHSENDTLVKPISAKQLARKCKKLHSLNILSNGSHKVDEPKIQTLVDILNQNNKAS